MVQRHCHHKVLAAVAVAASFGSANVARSDYLWIGGLSLNWFDQGNWLEDGAPPDFSPGCDSALGVNAILTSDAGTVLVKCANGGSVALGSLHAFTPLNIASTLTLDGASTLTSPVSID
ncbi:MAG: hypothetical protein KDA22_09565, partial [Phycisphaerales bacterium]|nr:hypothetical protein [Phycisphaerales bacterium]